MCSVLTASSLSAKTKKAVLRDCFFWPLPPQPPFSRDSLVNLKVKPSQSALLFRADPQREGAAMRMDFPEILEIPEVP